MKIGIVKEIKNGEGRVAMIPSDVLELISAGHEVTIEKEAGVKAGFTDEDYIEVGCEIASGRTVWKYSELLIKVKEPIEQEFKYFRQDLTIFSYLHLAACPFLVDALVKSSTKAIALENVEMNGKLPGLDPMSTIAGRVAGQLAMHSLFTSAGGSGLLLGGVFGTIPGKAVIIGGGVAGVAAARELAIFGTDVTVLDISPVAVDRINSDDTLPFRAILSSDTDLEAELSYTDVLIGAVLVPGAAAPKVVSESDIMVMPEGSVAIDIAIDQGGCIETMELTSWEFPSYVLHGVTHIGIPNLPGIVPRTSSEALSNVILPQALKIADGIYDKGLISAISIANGEIKDERIL